MSNFISTSKGKITIGIILFIIILSGAIYYFMYGSSEAMYTRSVKTITSHINDANKEISSTYKYLDSGKSSFDKVRSSFDSSKQQIDKALNAAKSATVPDKYKALHSNITKGINSNKLLISQSIVILDNYSSDTVKASISKLYEHLSTTEGYYEKLNYKDFKVNLSNDIINLPEKLSYYVNVLLKEDLGNSTTSPASLAFITDLKSNLESIYSIESSIEENINNGKSGKTSPNQMKILISSKLNELSSVIDSVNSLSSPEELKDLKTLFISTGVSYEDYLKSFKTALESSTEKTTAAIIDSSINLSKDNLTKYSSEKTSLKSLIREKEESLR